MVFLSSCWTFSLLLPKESPHVFHSLDLASLSLRHIKSKEFKRSEEPKWVEKIYSSLHSSSELSCFLSLDIITAQSYSDLRWRTCSAPLCEHASFFAVDQVDFFSYQCYYSSAISSFFSRIIYFYKASLPCSLTCYCQVRFRGSCAPFMKTYKGASPSSEWLRLKLLMRCF